jgi:hypothetical protein
MVIAGAGAGAGSGSGHARGCTDIGTPRPGEQGKTGRQAIMPNPAAMTMDTRARTNRPAGPESTQSHSDQDRRSAAPRIVVGLGTHKYTYLAVALTMVGGCSPSW